MGIDKAANASNTCLEARDELAGKGPAGRPFPDDGKVKTTADKVRPSTSRLPAQEARHDAL